MKLKGLLYPWVNYIFSLFPINNGGFIKKGYWHWKYLDVNVKITIESLDQMYTTLVLIIFSKKAMEMSLDALLLFLHLAKTTTQTENSKNFLWLPPHFSMTLLWVRVLPYLPNHFYQFIFTISLKTRSAISSLWQFVIS